MSEDNRGLEDEIYGVRAAECIAKSRLTAYSPALPVVHIAAADASLADLNADIPGVMERGDAAVFKGEVLDGAENEGGV